MLKYIILLLLSLACIRCGHSPRGKKSAGTGKTDFVGNTGKNIKKTRIKFINKLPAGKSTVFFYADKFDDTHLFKISGGKDSILEIHSAQPVLLFRTNSSQTPYLVYPADTIIVTHSKKYNDIQLTIKNNIKKNNELNFFRRGDSKIGKNHPMSIFKTLIRPNSFLLAPSHKLDFNLILHNASTTYKQQMDFLRMYAKKYDLSPYFVWFCKRYFYYNMIVNELAPFVLEKYKVCDYPEYFLDTLYSRQPDFNCDSCLAVLPYRIAANYYVKFLSRNELGEKQQFSTMYNKITRRFPTETKNYLLFHLIQTKLRKRPGYYKVIKDAFSADCTNAAYKNYLKSNYDMFTSGKNSRDIKGSVLLTPEGKALSWDSMLKRNAGKVVYLDFWASWCLPCREEMPNSFRLHAAYAHKNIVFIYISLDKKRTNWLNAINELGLPTKNNYLLLNEENAKLSKHLKIESIPKYILINANGEIIDLNAPRPDDKRIRQKIDLLLQQGNT